MPEPGRTAPRHPRFITLQIVIATFTLFAVTINIIPLIIERGAVGLWLIALVLGPIWLLIGIAMLAGGVRGCTTLLSART